MNKNSKSCSKRRFIFNSVVFFCYTAHHPVTENLENRWVAANNKYRRVPSKLGEKFSKNFCVNVSRVPTFTPCRGLCCVFLSALLCFFDFRNPVLILTRASANFLKNWFLKTWLAQINLRK